MNVQEINTAEEKAPTAAEARSYVARQYVEVPPRTVQNPTDSLTQLAANISSLENLHSELSFMIRELRGLNIKKR